MQSARWRRLDALFDAALACSPEDREGFVARSCGDDATLRAELAALLEAHAASGPLDRPPASLAEVPTLAAPSPSVLPAGARLGPYEVVALLGAGGMGEVYRARDPRLGREVAIKRIRGSEPGGGEPGSDVSAETLQRFDREARAAGALNHPNLLVVYDVGVADGEPYIVTELLEGETVRERLRSGPIPAGKALRVVRQIADGLAAAHDKGIVHRD